MVSIIAKLAYWKIIINFHSKNAKINQMIKSNLFILNKKSIDANNKYILQTIHPLFRQLQRQIFVKVMRIKKRANFILVLLWINNYVMFPHNFFHCIKFLLLCLLWQFNQIKMKKDLFWWIVYKTSKKISMIIRWNNLDLLSMILHRLSLSNLFQAKRN